MNSIRENLLFNKIRNILRDRRYIDLKNRQDGADLINLFWKLANIAYICDENGELWYGTERPFCVVLLSEVLKKEVGDIKNALDILENFELIKAEKGVISITVW